MDSMRFLRANAPEYLFESGVHGFPLPAVPANRIAKHLRPDERLLQLRSTQHRDELESKALRLAEFLSRNSGVPMESFGVTGSVLARIHDPAFSDIDLVVYGLDNALRVRGYLQSRKELSVGGVRRLTGASKQKWLSERLRSTPLTRQNAIALLARKWNIGLFEGTEFSIHAVHTEAEVRERYGDEHYVPFGIVEATAKIADSSESLFMPAVYLVESTRMKGNLSGYVVDQIVSFEGLYADIAGKGATVLCRGKLEKVESASGVRHRIVVGSPEAQGTDLILPLDDA